LLVVGSTTIEVNSAVVVAVVVDAIVVVVVVLVVVTPHTPQVMGHMEKTWLVASVAHIMGVRPSQ